MSGSLGMILVPAASGVGAVLLAVTQQDRPLMAAAGLLVLAASIAVGLAMVVGSRTGARRRTREQRERYLDYLEQVRTAAREGADLQRITAGLIHPRPSTVASAAWQPARRWERRPGDADFLLLRTGLGVAPLDRKVTLQVDENDPLVAYDPVCLAAAQELTAAYDVLADQPICVPLDRAVLTVIGPADRTRGVVRAVLAQLVWAHSPQEVAILVCSDDRSGAWDWLKWLPHSLSSRQRDGPLPARMITSSASQALDLLTAEITEPVPDSLGAARRTVVVIDQRADLSPSDADGAALFDAARAIGAGQIHLLRNRREEPPLVDIRLLVAGLVNPGPPDPAGALIGDSDLVEFGTAERTWCRFDDLDTAEALLLAKSFAPLRAADDVDARSGSPEHLLDPLRFGDVASIDPERSWRRRPVGDLLRVAIGTTTDGAALVLDLKESAQGGMGPHGLVVGATGSGKSELLRTLVTALAVAHPPETLALLLADFKGGATFSGLAALPHVTGMITNLEADATMIDRFRDALGGEVQRRQEMLASAGKLTALEAYVELRRRRPELEAMPHLLVIVDEFSELLGVRPDLADLFVTIGRIGRSIGIHLLLATQRLDTGRIRGLESHLSYRICLRTFSESESREAIGNPDAYHLPAEPGWGYLRADSPDHRLFRAMTVSRIYRPPQSHSVATGGPILPYSCHNGTAARIAALDESRLKGAPGLPIGPVTAAASGVGKRRDTVLDVAVERLTTLGPHSLLGQPARRVWLDPLPRSLILGELLSRQDPSVARDRHQALPLSSDSVQQAGVIALLGLIDVPARQRQELLEWDFSSGNGNLLVVGTAQSGKSTALRTLLVSLAVRYSPADVQVLCVDFGGETLAAFVDLPHVAAVATRSDPELTGRVFSRILGLLTERETLFRRRRFESTAALRRARAIGDIDANVPGDIVLILDGWAGMSESDAVPEGVIDEILRRGTGVGVHIVLTIASPSQLRSRLIGGFGGRIELRLSDSFDSSFDRQLAKSLPAEIPGRALVTGRHYAQIALPLLDNEGRDALAWAPGSRNEIHVHPAEKVIATVQASWPGQSTARIRTLPAQVSLTDLLALVVGEGSMRGMIIGLAEDDHRPVHHDLTGEHPHLVVYGEGRSGKTTVLRSLLAQLVGAGSSSGETDVAIIDYRRGLSFAAVTPRQQRDHEQSERMQVIATDPARASAVCRSLAARLAQRINDPVDARNLNRPTGAGFAASHRARQQEIVLLVDDYDLVGTRDGNPLLSLLPYLAHGADIGFHLILTRRAGGAARAQYESVLQTLGDLATPILMLSGSPAEGRLAHGIVPQLLPPGRARLAMRGAAPLMMQTAWVAADPAA